jgi:hypothetical protein
MKAKMGGNKNLERFQWKIKVSNRKMRETSKKVENGGNE